MKIQHFGPRGFEKKRYNTWIPEGTWSRTNNEPLYTEKATSAAVVAILNERVRRGYLAQFNTLRSRSQFDIINNMLETVVRESWEDDRLVSWVGGLAKLEPLTDIDYGRAEDIKSARAVERHNQMCDQALDKICQGLGEVSTRGLIVVETLPTEHELFLAELNPAQGLLRISRGPQTA